MFTFHYFFNEAGFMVLNDMLKIGWSFGWMDHMLFNNAVSTENVIWHQNT
jgi:hypothetical protein